MKALERNSTSDIVDKPKDKRVVGCNKIGCKGDTYRHMTLITRRFVLVTKMNKVRIILSLVVHFCLNIQQFDVKNVFLYGDLEKEVYMEISLGIESHGDKNKVFKLNKSLYDFKQSPWVWFGGFIQGQGDHTLFIKHSLDRKLSFLGVMMKELGKLNYFLGIKGIFIYQRKYVLDLLKDTRKLGCKRIRVPIQQNHNIRSEESQTIEKS
ncbi:hypothetical protein CR513_35729, partial [Mucuna pruriens]